MTFYQKENYLKHKLHIVLRPIRLLLLIAILPVSVFSQSKLIIRPTIYENSTYTKWFKTSRDITRPKVGIVLSGGGGRGLAQIGVLRTLEQHKIPIDLIVGNSLGSVVGGLYAAGYSTTEIESIAIHTNWSELLSFTEETKRTDLFIGQKQTQQEGYFSIRFNGLEPIIPSSISGGQRLSNFFSYLTLQALYHPDSSFDDLKIPFRVIATDILSGKRVVLDHGSLSEAMRASITVPLLYSPLERDSMLMVDGGLTSNIPVDVAKSLGCDVVIVVNSTSSLRNIDQLEAPWEVADQIMTIMMQESNKQQLKLADVVIAPVSGERLVTDFSGIDSLIKAGESTTEEKLPAILNILSRHSEFSALTAVLDSSDITVEYENVRKDDVIRDEISMDVINHTLTLPRIQSYVNKFINCGRYVDADAEVTDSTKVLKVVFHLTLRTKINDVQFNGNKIITDDLISSEISACKGQFVTDSIITTTFENILSVYRKRGYSLARIESVQVDSVSGIMKFKINEGRISDIQYIGNEKTRSFIIRREFPLEVGDVFNIDKAVQGIINIKSTGLFDYVLIDINYKNNEPVIVLKVKEKSSELMRIGFHADDEHGIVGTVDIRDANFRGAWEDFGVVMRYGYRDRFVKTEYTINRIFHSYFTLSLNGYYNSRDIFTYRYDPSASVERWERIENGKYREIKYGGSLSFGSHFKRLGDVTAEMRIENHRISSLNGTGYTPERYTFASLKFQSTIDTENKFSFPTEGIYLLLTFESATKKLGSDIGFGKIGVVYENYITILSRHTFRPKIIFGFADHTLPIAEQFSLGGLNSFLGLREDDSRGRQLLLMNMEYRFWLPFKLIFETYLKIRYDLGTISLIPEQIKFDNFHHGIGAEVALDTPLGPASFGAGKSFYFQRGLRNSPIAIGPMLFYFSIGPSL